MNVVHALVGFEANSGISEFVAEVAREQTNSGCTVSFVYGRRFEHAIDSRVRTLLSGGNLSQAMPDDNQPCVVHVHSTWSLFTIRAILWCLVHRVPFVFSPHGSLMPRVFEKGRVKKLVFWKFLLRSLISRAAMIHCTSEAEANACCRLGLTVPFVVVPLGVELPEATEKADAEVEGRDRVVLFMGRLSEEKGLMTLLDAWKGVVQEACVDTSRCAWRLVLAGPDWRGYQKALAVKVARERIQNVEFVGPADKKMKEELYRNADIFVLPSPMENFSMVVLEALAYGVPAIATKGTPWADLETAHCGRWIEQGVEALKAALRDLMKMTSLERRVLGANGRKLAVAKYQWSEIASTLLNSYHMAYGGNGGKNVK